MWRIESCKKVSSVRSCKNLKVHRNISVYYFGNCQDREVPRGSSMYLFFMRNTPSDETFSCGKSLLSSIMMFLGTRSRPFLHLQ